MTKPLHRRRIPIAVLSVAGLAAPHAMAQQGESAGGGRTAGPGLKVQASVSAGLTFTDNYQLSARAESDMIATATGSINAFSNSGPIRGNLAYSLTSLMYASHSSSNDLQQALSANAVAELVADHAFVEASASISQQLASPFGTQSATQFGANANRNEVRTLTVSPYLRGNLFGNVRYIARANFGITRGSTTSAGDTRWTGGSLGLSGGQPSTLQWSLDASQATYRYHLGQSTENDRIGLALSKALNYDLLLTLLAGQERYAVSGGEDITRPTWGARAQWNPSPRTAVNLQYERRFYGASHNINLMYRTARTVWTLTDSRDATSTLGETQGGRPGSLFDLLFEQFKTAIPDPAQRAIAVNNFLLQNGLSGGVPAFGAFLASNALLQRQQSLSLVVLGARTTLTLQAMRSTSQRLLRGGTPDIFDGGNVIRQRALSAALAYRLTPASTATLAALWQRNAGLLGSQHSDLSSLSATWTARLDPSSDFSLGARIAHSTSTGGDYDERAVFGNYRYRF